MLLRPPLRPNLQFVATRSLKRSPLRPAATRRLSRPVATAAMVQFIETERASAKGLKLATVTYLPDSAAGPPRAVLLFHHGVAEHVGRYKPIFERFAAEGIAVYSGDSVGHGKSEGDRALVESYPAAVDEFLALSKFAVDDVAKRYPGTTPPYFISGHSLGGLLAALAAQRDQTRWAGLMLCSPALDVEMGPVLKIQAALGGLLAAVVPKARIVPAVDPKDMNPDAACVAEYTKDPLNTVGNLATRTANEALKGMRWLRQHWPEIKLPLYMHHGEIDKCTSPKGSQAFYAAVGSKDKTLTIVPGGYHEVLFSPGVSQGLVDGMVDWIKQHSGGSSGGAAKM